MVVTVVEPHENLEDTSTLGPSPADNALENHPDDDTSEDTPVDDALEYNPGGVTTASDTSEDPTQKIMVRWLQMILHLHLNCRFSSASSNNSSFSWIASLAMSIEGASASSHTYLFSVISQIRTRFKYYNFPERVWPTD